MSGQKGPHDVRHELILCPVASPDHVTGPDARDESVGLPVGVTLEIGLPECGGHEFCAGLAARDHSLEGSQYRAPHAGYQCALDTVTAIAGQPQIAAVCGTG